MADIPGTPEKRSIWLRAFLMILMVLAFHLAVTVLGVLVVVQFVLALVTGSPNARLCRFGQSMGQYLRQIAEFETFASEDAPFPFSDWPAGD